MVLGLVCLAVWQLVALLPGATLAAATPTLLQAAVFVKSLYFSDPEHTHGVDISKTYDPSTAALFEEDRKLTPKGKIGALDFSPLCWCQNDHDLTYVFASPRSTGPGTADALVELEYRGEMQTQMQIHLVVVGNVWRVHDIDGRSKRESKPTSLRSILIRSNNMLAH